MSHSVSEALASNGLAKTWTIIGRNDDEIRQRVNTVLSDAVNKQQIPFADRRLDKRVPLPSLVELTPIANDSLAQISDPVLVVCKHVSERGMDFFHTENLPCRRAIVSLAPDLHPSAQFILNISWSRFLTPGWYDSGGRFTHVVSEDVFDPPAK